jgi:hypothetical protein
MSTVIDEQYNVLRQQIDNSLQKASAHKDRLKRASSRYSIFNILLSALATFVAGQAALAGGALVGGWRITCAVASGFALGATIVAGVQKQVADPDLMAEASECVGKLRALKIDTLAPTYDLDGARKKYQQILSDFSKIEC